MIEFILFYLSLDFDLPLEFNNASVTMDYPKPVLFKCQQFFHLMT